MSSSFINSTWDVYERTRCDRLKKDGVDYTLEEEEAKTKYLRDNESEV